MPTEPEKNIERTLNEYAQKRRDQAGAPMELHPVNRKLLQDEVRSTYAQAAAPAPSRSPFWSMFWRRLALAGSFAALFLMVSLVWRDMHRPPLHTVAYDETASPRPLAAPAESARATTPPAARPEMELLKESNAPREAKVTELADKANRTPQTLTVNRPDGQAILQATPMQPAGNTVTAEKDRSRNLAFEPTPRAAKAMNDQEPKSMGGENYAFKSRQNTQAGNSPAAPPAPPIAASGPVPRMQIASDELKGSKDRVDVPRPAPAKPQPAGRMTETDVANQLADNKSDAARKTQMRLEGSESKAANETLGRASNPVSTRAAGGGGKPAGVVEPKPERLTKLAEREAAKKSPITSVITNFALANARSQGALKDDAGDVNTKSLAGLAVPPQPRSDQDAKSEGQRFVQTLPAVQLRRNFNSPPRPQVLNSFQFEQDGNALKIIDADGSVYTGTVARAQNREAQSQLGVAFDSLQLEVRELAEVKKKSVEKAGASGQRGAGQAGGAAPGALSFQVSGINRSINQKVVFEGEMTVTNLALTVTNATVFAGAKAKAVRANLEQSGAVTSAYFFGINGASPQTSLATNVVIRGRAMVGESNQLEIDAIQAK